MGRSGRSYGRKATYPSRPTPSTLFGVHTHDTEPGTDFDGRRLGLDHVAFGVDSRDEPETWEARLDELEIAHGGIVDAHYGSGLSFRDPDGITLEIFAPPAG